jgi:hypothetical protein
MLLKPEIGKRDSANWLTPVFQELIDLAKHGRKPR